MSRFQPDSDSEQREDYYLQERSKLISEFVPIPEPSTIAMLLIGGGFLLRVVRKHKSWPEL